MINYFIQPNGTATAFMVCGDTPEETQGELWSLQNKGIAAKAEMVDECCFMFLSSRQRLQKAFCLQFVHSHWMDEESCQLYKGEKGGFYSDAKRFAKEKFERMTPVNWLFSQRRLPEIFSTGKTSAEKDSGDWKDTLTSVLQSH